MNIKPKLPGKRLRLPPLVVCFVCVLGLPNLGDATAAAFTGFGAGEGDELGDEEAD